MPHNDMTRNEIHSVGRNDNLHAYIADRGTDSKTSDYVSLNVHHVSDAEVTAWEPLGDGCETRTITALTSDGDRFEIVLFRNV